MANYQFTLRGFTQRAHIEADTYTAGDGFVTWVVDNRPVLSMPASEIAYVAELDADGEIPYTTQIP